MNFGASGLEASPVLLAGIGLAVGVLGGAFGVGGSFLAGPALYLAGMPLHYVVGTDLTHIAGKSIVAVRHHHALGNVDFRLAGLMVPPTVLGVELGARTLEVLKGTGYTKLVAVAYSLLLALLAAFIVIEARRARRRGEAAARATRRRFLAALAREGARARVGRFALVVLVASASGFLGGLLGGGAGYLRLPALVYLLGVPTKTAVGTDLCEVVVSALFGAASHGLKGNVDFPVALTMQIGGVIGARLGVRLTEAVREATLRLWFAPLPLVGAILTLLRVLRESQASA